MIEGHYSSIQAFIAVNRVASLTSYDLLFSRYARSAIDDLFLNILQEHAGASVTFFSAISTCSLLILHFNIDVQPLWKNVRPVFGRKMFLVAIR